MAHQTLKFNTRDEWLEARKQGIGASEVATIVGLNPWETPLQYWRRKTGRDAPKEYTVKMRAGHYLEDAVSLFFHDETGHEIIKSSATDFMIINPDKPFLRVSPDRTYWAAGMTHNDENKRILECKTTQMKVERDNIPMTWFVQLQMNLGVAEMKHGSLAWLRHGSEFDFVELDFDPDYYAFLVEAVERFWYDNIVGDREPEAVSAEDVIIKYPRELMGKVVEVDDKGYQTYLELKDIRAKISELDGQKDALENELKKLFGDAGALTHMGLTLATWNASKDSEVLDTKALIADYPDLAKGYMKIRKGARRLLIK